MVPALRRSALVAVTLCLSLSPSVAAAAHPQVEEGRALFNQADFAGALERLRQAEERGGLDRADLVLLLETRALVHRALGDEGAVDAALQALASIDPDHGFTPEVSPDVVQRFAQLRDAGPGPLALEVAEEEAPGGVALVATVRGDATGMVTSVTVRARVGGEPWQEGDRRLIVDAEPGTAIEWYAVARGPGGAPVARRGSEQAPRRARVPGAPAPPSGSDDVWLWVGIGSGVAALAAAAVILGVVFAGGGQAATRVDGPMWPAF